LPQVPSGAQAQRPPDRYRVAIQPGDLARLDAFVTVVESVGDAMKKHPMQPLERDEHGTIRFKANKIVEWLVDKHPQVLNEIAAIAHGRGPVAPFSDEDQRQLAQLLGYSLSGYADLSYVNSEDWNEASNAAEKLEKSLQNALEKLAETVPDKSKTRKGSD
jgi:hypothetical protein